MIPVFIISLQDSIDRRKIISKQLKSLKIQFEFIDAIDGRDGLPPEYEDQIDRDETFRKSRKLSDVEYACALSHIRAYQKIINKNISWALILEDDAVPQTDLVSYLESRCYEDAHLTQLYYGLPVYVHRWDQKIILGKFKSYWCSTARIPRSTVGYVISNYAAKFIVNNGVPVNQAADWPYCISQLIKQKKFRIVHPPLIHHNDMHLSIIDKYGRNEFRKSKRRFLGIYIPPKKGIIDTLKRSPQKFISKKINSF